MKFFFYIFIVYLPILVPSLKSKILPLDLILDLTSDFLLYNVIFSFFSSLN